KAAALGILHHPQSVPPLLHSTGHRKTCRRRHGIGCPCRGNRRKGTAACATGVAVRSQPARRKQRLRTPMNALKDKVGVVGAGLMGTEIALVFALAGHPVILCDVSETALEQAVQKLGQIYDRGAGRGMYQAELKPSVLGLIGTSTDLTTLSDCQMVTEAVF